MMPMIDLNNITFTYAMSARPALHDITLAVPAGQICGVVGRAGAGKSTLCALCAGFIPNFYHGQVEGTAHVDGQDVVAQSVADLVRHVGLVASNPFSQISGARFTVFEEIGFALENLGVPRDEMIERIGWALRMMQLEDLRDRSPYQLSGGQQQRLVLAATLALRPPVLVLDEPTAQLDPPTTAHLAGLLHDLSRQGTTILFAEHRLDWTAELADRVVVLDEGAIIADGPPRAVLALPLLRDRRIGWPRPALLAARARSRTLWPAARPLPVTLDDLIAGLREVIADDQPPSQDSLAALRGAPRAAGAERRLEPTREEGAGPATPSAKPGTSGVDPSKTQPAPIAQLEDVHFGYPSGVEALRGVSLAIGAGQRVALLGRNGAGKSTLVRHLNGLFVPTSGRAHVAGADTRTTTVAQCARHVGIVFQDIRNQLFARTVRDELRFGPRNLRYRPAQIEALVDHALVALGLTDVADEHPYDLPPARRRLVAIAAVLAMDSALLVLDEPTAGLDNADIARLATLARNLAQEGKSVLVVSHDLDFCFEALDRVILLHAGQVTLDSSWDTLDAPALERLDTSVGLPIALRVAGMLRPPSDSPSKDLLKLLEIRD